MAKNGITKGLSDILLQGLGETTDGGGSSKSAKTQSPSTTTASLQIGTSRQESKAEVKSGKDKKVDTGSGTDAIGKGSGVANIIIIGGGTGEVLTGSDLIDTLFGAGGNDIIIGFDNPTEGANSQGDSLYGGTGNDLIFGGSGLDSIYGGSGLDTLEGNAGNDFIEGQDGDDLITDGGQGVTFSTAVEVLVSRGPLPGEGTTESSNEHTDELANGTPLPTGGYVMVWGQGIGADQAPTQAMKFARFDALGNMIGNPVRFDTLHPGLGPFEFKGEGKATAMQGANSGRFAIVIESEFFHSDGDNKSHTYLYVFNADGSYVNSVQLSTNLDQTQLKPAVVATSDGGLLVTWQDNWLNGSGTPPNDIDAGIYMRKYTVSGSTLTPVGVSDIQVNQTTTGNQTSPEMLQLSNGNILVAWNSTQTNGQQDVYFRIFNNAGTAVTGEILASHITGVGNTRNEAISNKNLTNLTNGNFVVVYTSDNHAPVDNMSQNENDADPVSIPRPEGGDGILYLRIFNSSGTPVTTGIQVATGDIQDATVTYLPDGGFFVVWSRDVNGASGVNNTNYDIFGQRFDANGTAIGAAFQINTASDPTSEGATAIQNEDQRRPHLMTLANGTVVITWDSGKDPSVVSTRDEEIVQRIVRFGSSGGNDTMIGASGADMVMGESGNDILYAGGTVAGASNGDVIDVLQGGSGADILNADSGADSLFGGFGAGSANDSLAAADFARYADSTNAVNVNLDDNATETGGNAQGDFITGVEHLIGSAQNDSLTGIGTLRTGQELFAANNSLVGAGGADNLFGLDGNDSLFGDFVPGANLGGGNDNLFGGSGADAMYGGTGNDVLQGGAGADNMSGDAGVDTADYNGATSAVDVNLQAGTGSGSDAQGDVLSAIENVRGSSFGDTITGHDAGTNSGANVLSGEDGNDFLIGREGSDTLYGAQLTDQLFGGSGLDTLFGGVGDDTLHDGGGGAATIDTFAGEGGADYVSYLNAALAVNVNLTTNTGTGGDATNDSYSQIEHVIGGGADDILTGDGGGNTLRGMSGNDTMAGLTGGDVLIGDAVAGGASGNDWANYAASNAAVQVNLSTVGPQAGGHAQGDSLVGIEHVFGSTGAGDSITGSSAANSLVGFSGNDVLFGLSGIDRLFGDGDDDTLFGGSGGDILDGGDNGASKVNGDYAGYISSTVRVDVDLTRALQSGGEATGDSLTRIEHLIGSNTGGDVLAGDGNDNTLIGLSGNDTLIGRTGDDRLYGDATDGTGSGADSFFGGEGIDTIFGHEGNDTAEAGAGADSIFGGTGQDWASYLSSTDAVTVNLSDAATESGGDALGDALSGIEHLIGSNSTSAGDILTGSANNNSIRGADGNDTINAGGGSGVDAVFGETGNDLLIDGGGDNGDSYDGGTNGSAGDAISYAGQTLRVAVNLLSGVGRFNAASGDSYVNVENVIGGEGNDTLTGNASRNTIVAGGGDDTVQGGFDADSLDGGTGDNDWVDYTDSTDGVVVTLGIASPQSSGGHAAGDVLENFENLRGSTLDDTLFSERSNSSANNIIDGDQGDDSLIANSGIETFVGGGGSDLVDYRRSDDLVIVDLLTGQGQSGFAEDDNYTTLNGNGSGIENVMGSNFNDTIRGVAGFNSIFGFTGNDVIYGASSRDLLEGGDGDDTLRGGSGSDSIVGGLGVDFADYTGDVADSGGIGVRVDLETGRGSGGDAGGSDGFFDTLFGIEHLIGSSFADTLAGDNGANWLFGGAENDLLVGRGSAGDTLTRDTLFGGDGSDILGANAAGVRDTGIDSLFGGSGTDSLFYDQTDALISGGIGEDSLFSSNAADLIQLWSGRFQAGGVDIEQYYLGDGNDQFINVNVASSNDLVNVGDGLSIFGGSGNDQISMRGNAVAISGMDDFVDAGVGNDIVWGGFGRDLILGSLGDDQLYGGKGDDTLAGGAGFDVYYVGHDEGTDIIQDKNEDTNGLVLFWGWDSTFGGNYDGLDPSEVSITYSGNDVFVTMQNGGEVHFTREFNGSTWECSVDVLNLWDYGQGEAGNSPTPPSTFQRDVWSVSFDVSTGRFQENGLGQTNWTLAVNG